MRSLAGKIGMLGGIVCFCAVLLIGLVQGNSPLAAIKRAGFSAVLLALVLWLCIYIAFGVVRGGLRQHSKESPT